MCHWMGRLACVEIHGLLWAMADVVEEVIDLARAECNLLSCEEERKIRGGPCGQERSYLSKCVC